MHLTLTEATAENFLQYKTLRIPLNNQGLIFVRGEMSHDQGCSNGTGKTSFLSLVPYLIWGKALREVRDVSRIIKYGATYCSGRLEGYIDDNPFWIERHRDTKGNTSLTASFAGASRKPDVQVEINRIFNTFNLAQNTRFLAQRKALEFISAGDPERRKIIEDLLRISKWRQAQELVVGDLKWAVETKVKLEYKLQEISTKRDMLLQEIRHQQEMSTNKLDLQAAMLYHTLDQLNTEVEDIRKKAADLKEDEQSKMDRHAELLDDLNNITQHRNEVYTAYNEIYEKLRTAQEIEASFQEGVCPTCHRELSRSITLTGDIATLQQELLQKQILKITVDEEYNKVLLRHRDSAKDLERVRAEYNQAYSAFLSKRTALETNTTSLKQIQQQIEEVRQTVIVDRSKELVELEHQITVVQKSLDLIDVGTRYMETCKSAFSYRGVPAKIIARSLPLLVQQTNNALRIISDNVLSMDILPTDTKSDGKLLERLTFLVYKNGREGYFEECSAGEQNRIVVSLFMGLASIQNFVGEIWWNVCFIDELFDGLDLKGIEQMMLVLRTSLDIPTIIVTSHRSELMGLDGFAHNWLVRAHGEDSELLTP